MFLNVSVKYTLHVICGLSSACDIFLIKPWKIFLMLNTCSFSWYFCEFLKSVDGWEQHYLSMDLSICSWDGFVFDKTIVFIINNFLYPVDEHFNNAKMFEIFTFIINCGWIYQLFWVLTIWKRVNSASTYCMLSHESCLSNTCMDCITHVERVNQETTKTNNIPLTCMM